MQQAYRVIIDRGFDWWITEEPLYAITEIIVCYLFTLKNVVTHTSYLIRNMENHFNIENTHKGKPWRYVKTETAVFKIHWLKRILVLLSPSAEELILSFLSLKILQNFFIILTSLYMIY